MQMSLQNANEEIENHIRKIVAFLYTDRTLLAVLENSK